ncbi:MAG TPA: hypothetical protein VM492_09955 [Sumerlaeia bacterium]|nr:hypothetical protein [Sumerlaeia bacterium]
MKTYAQLRAAVEEAEQALKAAQKALGEFSIIDCSGRESGRVCRVEIRASGAFAWSGEFPTADDMRYALAEAERRGWIPPSKPVAPQLRENSPED